jgi:hypothetical protein
MAGRLSVWGRRGRCGLATAVGEQAVSSAGPGVASGGGGRARMANEKCGGAVGEREEEMKLITFVD